MTSTKRMATSSSQVEDSTTRKRRRSLTTTSTSIETMLTPTASLYQVDDTSEDSFHGPYQHLRRQLDYGYHSNYLPQRQAFQDEILHRALGQVQPNATKDTSIVFTAG